MSVQIGTAAKALAGMQLYLDGDLVVSYTTVTTAEPVTAGYLRFGYDNLDGLPNAPDGRCFAGTLDDATFYLIALSAAQIAAQYEAGI